MDTLDGISNSGKKDKFGYAQMLCPLKHKLKRHRLRDERYQYYCKECKQYYTENNKLRHIKKAPDYYDAFINSYIKAHLKNETPNIIELCSQHKLSRASVYRHLLSKDKKLSIDLIVELSRWAKDTFGGIYKRDIHNGTLRLKHQAQLNDLIVRITPILKRGTDHSINITAVFNQTIKYRIPESPLCKFNGREFMLRLSNDEGSLSAQLTALAAMLRNV